MSENKTEMDLSLWFSTYGLLTSTRILERFHIQLSNDDLIIAMKDPVNVYHQLLIVPLRNVFNGIILQQAHDYQVFAQKLFVDYLLSGESGKPEDSPGASTREDLEQTRLQLMELGESFNKEEMAQQQLIAESQNYLINVARELQKSWQTATLRMSNILKAREIIKEHALIKNAIQTAMIHYCHDESEMVNHSSLFWKKLGEKLNIVIEDNLLQELHVVLDIFKAPGERIQAALAIYLEKTEDLGISIRSFRSQFYDIIIKTNEYLNLLPEYHQDLVKLEENRSSLHFDTHIGEAGA